ncbi:MAG: hypothetical protein AAGA92_11690 [Planctomycetota bacterium]
MSEFVESLNSMPMPFSFVIWLVLIILGGGAFSTVCKEVRRVVCRRFDVNLKRDLIDRGLEPEEVERLVAAAAADVREAQSDSKDLPAGGVVFGNVIKS